MLKTTIKASAIANLTDARYFSAWGVEWLGFCLDSSDNNYVSPAAFHAMREWLVGPKIVGELGAVVDTDALHQLIESHQLDAVQVGQFAKAADVAHLAGHLTLIREQVLEQLSDLENLCKDWDEWSDFLEFFLLDFEKNGISWKALKANQETFQLLKKICSNYPVMLSISFDTEDFDEIQAVLDLHGLALKGGEEEKVGYKSFDQLDDIYECLLDEY